LPPSKTAGAFTWNDDQSLELTLRNIKPVAGYRLQATGQRNNKAGTKMPRLSHKPEIK
jgi:hypothetical protein